MPPSRARDLPTGRGAPHTNIGAGRAHANRNGGNGPAVPAPPGRGGPPRGGGPGGRGGGGRGGGGGGGGMGGSSRPSHILDTNVWTHLIRHLQKAHLLPVVNFVFSKKRCEEYANNLGKMDLCDAKEKSEVHITWERALNRLKGELTCGTIEVYESKLM